MFQKIPLCSLLGLPTCLSISNVSFICLCSSKNMRGVKYFWLASTLIIHPLPMHVIISTIQMLPWNITHCWNLGSNSSLQNRLVRWGVPPLYKLWSSFLSNRRGTKSTPSKTSQHQATRGRSQLRWNYQPTPSCSGQDFQHTWGGITNPPLNVRGGISNTHTVLEV